MSTSGDEPETERVERLESALAESQRLEREEAQADIDRQVDADERIVQALSKEREDGEQ